MCTFTFKVHENVTVIGTATVKDNLSLFNSSSLVKAIRTSCVNVICCYKFFEHSSDVLHQALICLWMLFTQACLWQWDFSDMKKCE